MGSNFNFRNFGYDLPADGGGGGGGRPPSNIPLTRQSSIYSLTFDEFQTTVGGLVLYFGSMNMDELLKSIWSAEENQNNGTTSGAPSQEGLQKQGSLNLPRTISQKTVDEVWKDMLEDSNGNVVGFGVPQREPTLGEITLEEFLVRAGVVREENQWPVKPTNDVGFFGAFSRPMNNSGLGFGYQQHSTGNANQIGIQSAKLQLNFNGVRSAAQQQLIRQQNQQQQILPKQPVLSYGAPMGGPTGQLGSPTIREGIAGISEQAMNNNGIVQNVGLQGMVNLGGNGVSVATGSSPAVSSEGLSMSNGDTPSDSHVPCVFNGTGLWGTKTAALEKVVERRQRRMIKNRESAARSRDRKQAYTTELEAEVAKLKEENEELRKKQELMEMQKNQVMEMMNQRGGAKRRCLRRTQTGTW